MEPRPKTSQGTKTSSGRIVSKTSSGRLPQKTTAKTPTGPGEMPVKPGLFEKLIAKVNTQIVSWLLKNALPPAEGIALQAGSGTAVGAGQLAASPQVRLSVALDFRMEALKEAHARDPKVACVRGDLFRLPFKNGSFDLVWNNSTLEHIHDKRRVVCEMVRGAKDGGRVFVGVAYGGGPLVMIQSWVAGTRLGKKIGNLFDEETLAIDFEGTGLTLEQFATFYYRTFLGCLARKG